jgi:Zn-dependent protease
MHPTFLVLVALAALGMFGPPLDGLVWLAVLFGSVITHELAHCVVARRLGLHVRDIVLLPIGGASEIDGLEDDPSRELWVAVAGPVSSFLLAGAIAAGIAVGGGTLRLSSLVDGPLVSRAMIANVVLGAFNLVPALPMDGGRMLRAVLARRVGHAVATQRAAALGRRLAIVMGIIGALFVPWLLLIAVFVYFSARAEATGAILHARLAGLRVRDLMTPIADPEVRLGRVTVHEEDDAEAALTDLAATPDGIATVVDAEDRVTGVLLARHVAEALAERR